MASNRLRELMKTERLRALKDARRDNPGDIKQMIVYEIIPFQIQQKNRTIKKRYFRILHKEKYIFTSLYNEVVLYQNTRAKYSKLTPYQLHIQQAPEDYVDMLIQYHNEQSQKYYDMIIQTGEYENRRVQLMNLEPDINHVEDLVDYMLKYDFKL